MFVLVQYGSLGCVAAVVVGLVIGWFCVTR